MPRKLKSSRSARRSTATSVSASAALLSEARYAQLVADVQQLAERANTAGARSKVVSMWTTGRRILREHLSQAHGYHNTVLTNLARDTPFNIRNLQYAVAFYRAYEKCPKHALSWAHYRVLLERATPETRERYAQVAVDQGLDVRGLRQYIALDQPSAPATDSLPRPTQASYLYKADVLQVIDGDTLDLRIDLGFYVERRGRFRLANLNAPELPADRRGGSKARPQDPGRAARDFIHQRLLTAKTLVVQTRRVDIHGRYVAHLFYSAEDLTIDQCFTNGTYLNNEILAEGHAELMLM